MEGVYWVYYLANAADQVIPGELVKVTFLREAKTTIRLGIMSWFANMGLSKSDCTLGLFLKTLIGYKIHIPVYFNWINYGQISQRPAMNLTNLVLFCRVLQLKTCSGHMNLIRFWDFMISKSLTFYLFIPLYTLSNYKTEEAISQCLPTSLLHTE